MVKSVSILVTTLFKNKPKQKMYLQPHTKCRALLETKQFFHVLEQGRSC